MVQSLWKIIWWFFKKPIIELSYDSAIPLLGRYTKELKTRTQTDVCMTMFIAALFMVARKWKQPRCPSTAEMINKMWISSQWKII
jgi:hypothetical protein